MNVGKIVFLLSLVLPRAFISFSQSPPVNIIKGKIINASTGEPVGYATIRGGTNGIATMSNEEGRFIFKMPAAVRNDSIFISHVGYRQIALIIGPADTNGLLIKLQEKAEQLSAVQVTTVNALNLIRKAIGRIPENYPSKPYMVNGFYRITGTKGKTVIDLSEAVFAIYNGDYSRKTKQFKLVKARWDKDLTAFNGNDDIDFGARPSSILNDDMISNVAGSELFNELEDYDLTFKGFINYNGQEAYEIAFDQKDNVKKTLYEGRLILDTHSLAFLEISYRLSKKGIKYWGLGFRMRVLLNLAHIHVDLLQSGTNVTYRPYGGKYYLDHVNGESLWHIVGGKKRFELNPYRSKYNCVITSIDTTGVEAFKKGEALENSQFIEKLSPDKNTDSTDSFWESYNLIQAEFNVDSIAKAIRSRNEGMSYKRMLEDKLSKYSKDKSVRIDSILSFFYQKQQFSGAALVKYRGKVIYEKAYGLAKKDKHIPNSPQTQFRIGSASKQFTAMLIIQLANENKLSLDDTVGKFLPGYVHGKVTIQQLLTHQSGIPNYTDNEEHLAAILSKKYALDELVSKFCSDPLEFDSGTQFEYTNSGYVVLADIIEKITGKKYADVLSEKILVPLGMKNTYFGTANHDMTNLATGYVNDEPEKIYPIENETGAGGITSTVEDLSLWADALSSGKLLSKDKTNELFKPRVEWKEWDAYYGYGWMIDKLQFEASKKHTIQYHPGTEVGFYAMIVRQEDEDIVLVLLNNTGDFPRFDITDLILSQLN